MSLATELSNQCDPALNLFQRLDRRFWLALQLAEIEGLDAHHDDRWIQAYLEYHHRNLCEPKQANLCEDVGGALQIWQGDRVLKQMLESRLMNGQSAVRVAERLALPRSVVEAYEFLFLDFSDDRKQRWLDYHCDFEQDAVGTLLMIVAMTVSEAEFEEVVARMQDAASRDYS